VITRRDLVRALGRRNVADWIVIEREQDVALADEARALQRREKRTRLALVLHHDDHLGRGTARIELAARNGDALAVVDRAIALARAAIGPVWKSVPPAAPAKVEVADPALAKTDLRAASAAFLGGLARPAGTTVTASVELMRERVTVQSRAGLHVTWDATLVTAHALIAAADRSLDVHRQARRIEDVAFAPALAAAETDLKQLAGAGAPAAGHCALVLGVDALLHDNALGLWSVFATQADPQLERAGLARYRVGAPVAQAADQVREPLTITSDGTIDFAARSARMGDDGDAIRRFDLVEGGTCAGLALDGREAALRHKDPNGGVRNLVVWPGTWNQRPPAMRTIEVRRLRAIALDGFTGHATLELGLAIDHDGDRARPFTGGSVRLDLIAALARAQRSAASVRRGPYVGPASVLVDDAELIA